MVKFEREIAYIKKAIKEEPSDWLDEALNNQGVFYYPSYLDGDVGPVDLLVSICMSLPKDSWLKKAFQQAVEILVAKYVKENGFICSKDKVDSLVMLAGLTDATGGFSAFLNLAESEIGKENYYLHEHLLRLFIDRSAWLDQTENISKRKQLIAICQRDIKDSLYAVYCSKILCQLGISTVISISNK